MIKHLGTDGLGPAHFDRPVVTLGVFDGVHLGHRALLARARDMAARLGGDLVVVTFDIHHGPSDWQFLIFVMWKWFVDNSAGVQAIGTMIAIGIAIFVPWKQHRNDLAHTRRQRQEERLLHMETAAAIAINAMNRIEEAWKNVVENPGLTQGYYLEVFNRQEFDRAGAALHEINLSNLPDWEMVQPILELRDLIGRASVLVEGVAGAEHDGSSDPDEGREYLAEIHRLAHRHTTNIEAAVNRMRPQG